MNSQYNPETLNAYVDGELSARDKAAVANAIANNRELARQAATLSSLKATLSTMRCTEFDKIDLSLPEIPGKPPKKWVAVAASFLLATVTTWLLLSNHSLLPNQGLALAEQAHLQWLSGEMRAARSRPHRTASQIFDLLNSDAYIPDLSKVDLSFNGIRRVSSGNSNGIHIGYLGPSGCMVSLVVVNNTTGLSDDLAYFERDGHMLYGWQVKQTGFYLLAHKMDPERLSRVARVVNRLTRERLPLTPEAIVALNQARQESKPCLA